MCQDLFSNPNPILQAREVGIKDIKPFCFGDRVADGGVRIPRRAARLQSQSSHPHRPAGGYPLPERCEAAGLIHPGMAARAAGSGTPFPAESDLAGAGRAGQAGLALPHPGTASGQGVAQTQ